MEVLGITSHDQMVTNLLEGLVLTNQAFKNSKASVKLKPAYIGLVRYCFLFFNAI